MRSQLSALHARYYNNTIYTNVGDILLAINPYKQLGFYGDKQKTLYSPRAVVPEGGPHIYAISRAAFKNLWSVPLLRPQLAVTSPPPSTGHASCAQASAKAT